MSLTNRGKLFQAMQELFKELDSCEQKVKKTEQIRDAYKGSAQRLIQRIKELKGRCADLQAELDKARSENCAIFKVHLSDESEKIAELNKEVADLREACEVELNNGAPFEKGYFLRLTKKEYELYQDDRFSIHVAYMKRSDK